VDVARETEAEETHEARTGAQAVERAIAIVSCFDSDVPDLGLSEIATRTGLRVSTAHRIVRALVRGGLLAQDPRTERYHLGRRLAVLGQSAMARYGLDLVRPQLEELAHATGEAASLGVRDGDDVVVVLRAESTQPLRFDRPHGARVPLHASAMGKALLAFAGPEPESTVADLGELTRFTPHTLVRRTDLVADLVATRSRGYSINREERHDGVCGVGAPVLDAGGTARASVAIQGPSHRFDERRLSELGERVIAAAEAIAVALPPANL
jgi:IclR family acetate operon transcriptional repressor